MSLPVIEVEKIEPLSCSHCGQLTHPSSLIQSHSKYFCCHGCAAAAQFLSSKELNEMGLDPSGAVDFKYLDSESSLKTFCEDSEPHVMNFYLEKVDCASCLWVLEQLPQWHEEIENVQFNMGTGVLKLRKSQSGYFSQAAGLLNALGFKPHPVENATEYQSMMKRDQRQLLQKLGVSAICAGNIMLFSVSLYAGAENSLGHLFQWLSGLLFLPILFYGAEPFFLHSWRAMLQRQASIDMPIALSVAVGALFSYWFLLTGSDMIYFDSLGVLVTLLLGARYFLKRIQGRYLNNSHLMQLLRRHPARRVSNSKEVEWVGVDDLRPGDRVLVKIGESFPADAKILSSAIWVNPSLLNGESQPQYLETGQIAFAGTILESAEVELEVIKTIENSQAGLLLKRVEEAIYDRSESAERADIWARHFTIGLMVVGFGFFFIYSFFNLEEALQRSLALFVVACPCALAFAAPLTQSLSMVKAAKKGILIKSASVLDRLSKIKNIIFDKTGTLTKGQFEVLKWSPQPPTKEHQEIIFAIEQNSFHPVARSLLQEFNFTHPQKKTVTDFKEISGWGVSAEVEGDLWEIKKIERTQKVEKVDSFIGVFRNGQKLYEVQLGDQLRENVSSAVNGLKKEYDLHLLSGDSQLASNYIGEALGFKNGNIRGDQTPEMKSNYIKNKADSLMVGDGVNDTEAMAHANVSLALQGSAEGALRVAEVYANDSGPEAVVELLHIAQQSHRILKKNLYFAIGYNSVAGVLALLGFIGPLVAAILMPISSLIVVASTLLSVSKGRT